MATRIKIREVRAGDFMRIHIFPVRNIHRGRRQKHYRESDDAQKRYNAKMRAMRTADLLHANFTEADYALRLSYTGESPCLADGKADLRKFIRRLRPYYRRAGIELRALGVTAEGKNQSRVHHHLVLSACPGLTDDQRLLRKLWANGGRGGATSYVWIEPLEFDRGEGMDFSDGGLTGLSKYVIFDNAEDGREKGERAYFRTRNLCEPEIREKVGEISARQAAYINATADKQILAELYPGYDVRTVVPSTYIEADAPPLWQTGLFTTVYLSRRRGEEGEKCRGSGRCGR